MSSLQQLANSLTQLSETLKQTNALISRLAKLSFQPGSEPLDDSSETDTVRVELAQDIHDSLKQLEEDLELLKQDTDELNAGHSSGGQHRRSDTEQDRERARLSAQVARVGEDIRQSRGRYRKAVLTAKRNSEAAKQRERELLFQSLQSAPETRERGSGTSTPDLFAGRSKRPGRKLKQLSKEEQQLAASSDVTAALRRTHNLLSTELTRSRFAQETFDQSTAALAELGERYTDLGSILEKSRDLLGTLLRSQKSDTWYLETAFYLLCATGVWLIFRRLLLGPFIRLPLFLTSWAWTAFYWMVLTPLWYLGLLTGVITSTPVAAKGAAGVSSSSVSRPPLIVQPSATGGFPKMADSAREAIIKGGVPAGAGGAGAKVGKDGKRVDAQDEGEKLSDEIGKMHDESGKQRRGDETVLRERGEDEKPNRKKKMFEADVEDAKEAAKQHDEL